MTTYYRVTICRFDGALINVGNVFTETPATGLKKLRDDSRLAGLDIFVDDIRFELSGEPPEGGVHWARWAHPIWPPADIA